MNQYHMWFNLKDGHRHPPRDLEFAGAVGAYMEALRARGVIESWSLSRRKFGFGPPGLGEFHCVVSTRDLAQLDAAFSSVATRDGEIERLHAPVYSAVCDFVSALYRDFPDPERGAGA